MAEHSTVNRRVAGSSPAWGVFSIIRARISFKPFLMPVSLTEKIKSSNKLNFSMCLYGEPGVFLSHFNSGG